MIALDPPRLVLVHSPLSAPDFWRPVCDALWASGHRAMVGRLTPPEHVHPPYWLTHAAGVAAGIPDDERVVLVGHGGAGALLPAIGRLARNRQNAPVVAGYLFVDCDLPREDCSRFDLFESAEAADGLRRRAVRGWLPRWSTDDLAAWIEDPEMRARLAGDLPRVPVALYEEVIGIPEGWPEAPCGYLSLSGGYPEAAATANERRWSCQRLDGDPFLPVTKPGNVAAALAALTANLMAAHRGS